MTMFTEVRFFSTPGLPQRFEMTGIFCDSWQDREGVYEMQGLFLWACGLVMVIAIIAAIAMDPGIDHRQRVLG